MTIEKIIEEVSCAFNIPVDILVGKGRTATVSEARQVSMAIAYWQGLGTLHEISTAHGRSNHGTVIYACNQVESHCKYDPCFKSKVQEITKSVSSQN